VLRNEYVCPRKPLLWGDARSGNNDNEQ
jgi:hypothetical protein